MDKAFFTYLINISIEKMFCKERILLVNYIFLSNFSILIAQNTDSRATPKSFSLRLSAVGSGSDIAAEIKSEKIILIIRTKD